MFVEKGSLLPSGFNLRLAAVTDHDKIDLSCVEHQGPALLTVGLRSGGYVALILLNAGFIMALTLEQAWNSVLHCAEEMNARYRDIVFDELAIVSIDDTQARTLSYEGPRKEAFSESFPKDSANLRATVRSSGQHYDAGDFEFSHAGAGTGFEAFMMLGKGLCLICNNTGKSMDGISKNPRWLEAQIPFAELSDQFRSQPLLES